MSDHILNIHTRDGHQFDISCFCGKNAQRVLLFFPAMGVAARYYNSWAKSLAEQDFLVCLADLRGHGTSSIRPKRGTDFGYHQMIENDYQAAIEAVLDYSDSKSLFLGGHSLGGQLSCLYAATRQNDQKWLAGLLLIGACTIYHKGWSGYQRLGMRLVPHIFSLTAKLLGYFPGNLVNFAGTEARQQMLDWANSGISGMYRPLGYNHALEPAMEKVQVPLLALSFDGDNYAPKAAVDHLVSKMSGCQINLTHLTAEHYPQQILDHFKWARNKTDITTALVSSGLTAATFEKTRAIE